MAYGTLAVDTLNTSTGVLATQNGITGIAKAWGSYLFVASGSVPTLRSAFNISSITRNSAGNYTFAFTTAMPDANYGCACTYTNTNATSAGAAYVYSKSTASFIAQAGYASTTSGTLTGFDNGIDFVVIGN